MINKELFARIRDIIKEYEESNLNEFDVGVECSIVLLENNYWNTYTYDGKFFIKSPPSVRYITKKEIFHGRR